MEPGKMIEGEPSYIPTHDIPTLRLEVSQIESGVVLFTVALESSGLTSDQARNNMSWLLSQIPRVTVLSKDKPLRREKSLWA